ncbi:Phosphatidylinositol 4-kinase pik1alpha (PI4-kinase)(PtdIns-4-kinase) [Pichia californica]|uniref:1-phosphatidylinositol 4-kinase n=1 Tax=Pichia californica TaxID=460514 RepID=A0A9P6WLD1_9ASCO|nr:Phosphatidylinositol 4-kinase pik1alpha (PI4-kinase)(PtdIns-4-kinase) [[Candida] californica]KAG0687833.1 Phosphatidylinositol 4-kinase pik1alpha (PI4-kinase)(PtdIns-4-kinase) [[Candida] californica]
MVEENQPISETDVQVLDPSNIQSINVENNNEISLDANVNNLSNIVSESTVYSTTDEIDNNFEKLSINVNNEDNKVKTIDETTSSTDLYTKINSKDFEIFHCISSLEHNSNVGIQYYICKRIQQFPIGELRFFAPQFLQLLITMETQSMALEEMIKEICFKDPHFSLITFWHLQAMLQDLSKEPESVGFQTCKRLVNELQYNLFNYSNNSKTIAVSSSGVVTKKDLNKDFRPNVYPSIILATSLLSGITVPESTAYVEPIVKMEGKKVKTMVFEVVKDIKKSLTENLTKKNTLNNALMSGQRSYSNDLRRTKSINTMKDRKTPLQHSKLRDSGEFIKPKTRKSEELGFEMIETYADLNFPNLRRPSLKGTSQKGGIYHANSTVSVNTTPESQQQIEENDDKSMTRSMPDLHDSKEFASTYNNTNVSSSPNSSIVDMSGYRSDGSYASSIRYSSDYKDSLELSNNVQNNSNNGVNGGNTHSKSHQHILLTDLQKVKLLKSSYFKNETQFVIALQNISIRLSKVPKEARLSTLKAELSILNKDLPCEIDIPMLLPKNKRGKLHKICRIAVNESAVLNSAERVPYLLLIEYLSDEVDFDPFTSSNKKILRNIQDYDDISGNDKYKFDLSYKSPKRNISTASASDSTFKGDEPSDVEEGDLADISVIKLTNKMGKSSQNIDLGTILSKDSNTSLQIPPLNALSDHEHNIATQLRIASIMLTQLDSQNSPLPHLQASQIRNRIIDSMQTMQNRFAHNDETEGAGERKLSNDMKVAGLSYLGEDWNTKKARIRSESKFGHLDNWDLFSMIAKTGDDLAQEAFACQLIHLMANIWYQDKVKVWVKRMKIIVTSINTGLVETITNAVSVHSIKKALEKDMLENNELPPSGVATLKDHFKRLFGDENSAKYKMAQENFSVSLAAYSVICYILQIKDRHNGNIMFDSEGHIVHIDFGFLLSNSPGSVGFENAPFKLTQEYIDVLGGLDSYYFQKFKTLTKEAFKSLRRNAKCIIDMVALMQTDSSLPCFKAGENTSVLLEQRFQLHLNDTEVDSFIENILINKSLNSTYTRLYDQFQLLTQGIYI